MAALVCACRNQAIHVTFVPVIFWSSMVMLGPVTFESLGLPVPDVLAPYLTGALLPNISLLITAAYVLYYLTLSRTLGTLGSALVVALLVAANTYNNAFPGNGGFRFALGAHVFAWAAQFYGHDVHERAWFCAGFGACAPSRCLGHHARVCFAGFGPAGGKPALLEGLFQSLFMAPLFITIEVLSLFGFLKDFHKSCYPFINAKRKSMNEAMKGSAAPAAAAGA